MKTTSQTQGSPPLADVDGSAWRSVRDVIPPPDVAVETKIDDERGCRNQAVLKRHNNLWFFADMSMYVYYSPTHWRHLPNAQGEARADNAAPHPPKTL